jgi:hypothetical protein
VVAAAVVAAGLGGALVTVGGLAGAVVLVGATLVAAAVVAAALVLGALVAAGTGVGLAVSPQAASKASSRLQISSPNIALNLAWCFTSLTPPPDNYHDPDMQISCL